MANITHLQMWKDICADARIGISKSLFGLKTTATFIPTGSIISVHTSEYSPADGSRISTILKDSQESLAKTIGTFRPKQTQNGNYKAEVCVSNDEMFAAVQLFQYQDLDYSAVTNVHIYEGENAKLIKQLFSI